MKKYLAILLVLFMPPVFAQEVTSTYTGNIFNPTGTPTDVATTLQGYGTINEPITCMAPGEPGYCGPYAAVNGFGADMGLINFSYGTSDIFQDFNLRNILPANGQYIITGYDFTFLAKNGNGWDDGRLDYLYTYVDLFKGNNLVSHNVLDLNYQFSWTYFYFGTTFDTPYKLSEVDGIRIGFVGRDNNFWAGFYGPEVTQIGFGVYYQEDPCAKDPLSSPSCAGYIEALMALVNVDTTTTEVIVEDTSTPVEKEEVLVADETTTDETTEGVVDEVDDIEEKITVETVASVENIDNQAAYRELTDEEKAAILADAISKSAIESALAIAASAESKSIATTETSNMGVVTTTSNAKNNIDNEQTNNNDSSSTGDDVVEIGRQTGIAALAATLAQSDNSATESIEQAESLAMIMNEQNVNQETDSQIMTEAMSITIDPVIEQVNNTLQLVKDNTPTFDGQNNNNNNGLSDDEMTTVMYDPALANSFNVSPNIANLEILGVIKPNEEKTDAEKRAEEVVAANAKEQEEINNNYMEADQSGLVAAIGADADVSSYRKAMLPDNFNWYKPEDIYKNVTYKDNVRGMYFLEKGNTDTYNKMVEEQYK